jgi:sulfide dehydrogenase cytochrome subunit
MGTLMKASLFVLAALAAASTHAAEPTGEAMAATCAACHGTHGKLGIVEYMPLAGLSEKEFVRAMQDFRSGKRPATLMGHVANGFSDIEIRAMAKYFANVE